MIGTKEHYDLLAQFEKDHQHMRMDREEKSLWKNGHVYKSGETNDCYCEYIKGYCLAKSIYNA